MMHSCLQISFLKNNKQNSLPTEIQGMLYEDAHYKHRYASK